MVKLKLLTFSLFLLFALDGNAQDSLQVFVINVNGDTNTHVFSKYNESSSLVFKKKTEQMHFGEEIPMQLFDNYGTRIKSVKSKELNLSNVKKGMYYINFFNREEEKWLTVKVLVKN